MEAVKLLETLNVPWTDLLPIEIKSGKYQFKTKMTAEIETLKSEDILDLPSSATADECMESLIERYDLEAIQAPKHPPHRSVRYGMERAYFSRTNPFVLAKDISIETVELLSERSTDLPGIETQVEQTREYPEGDLAPHIVARWVPFRRSSTMPPRKRATRIPPQTFPAIPIRIPSAKAALRACSSLPCAAKTAKRASQRMLPAK